MVTTIDGRQPRSGVPPRGGTGLYATTAALLSVLLLATCTDWALPPRASPCGRLREVGVAPDMLSQNHVRLDLPSGEGLRSAALDYMLRDGEALSVVLDRHDSDFWVLRLSRNPRLPSAALRFASGRIAERVALASAPAAAPAEALRHLVVVRVGGELRAALDGLEVARLASAVPGGLELTLFPPWSIHLFDRVTLGAVTLATGRPLEPHVDWLATVFASPLTLVALALLLARPLAGGSRPLLTRWFRHHAASSPILVPGFVAGLAVLAAGAALAMAWAGNIPAVGLTRRLNFAALLAVFVAISLLYLRLRDAWLGWREHRPRKPWRTLASIWVGYAVLVVAAVEGLGWAGTNAGPEIRALVPAGADPGQRIVCFGGSATIGLPLQGTPYTWPRQLEEVLHERAAATAQVINLGWLAATLSDIQRWLPGALAKLHPSQVLLYSVHNNGSLSPEEFGAALDRFLTTVEGGRASAVLVTEQAFEVVYDAGPSPRLLELLDVYRQVGARRGVVVIDPLQLFRAHREEFLFVDDEVHLTRYGNRLLAEAVAEVVGLGRAQDPGAAPVSTH